MKYTFTIELEGLKRVEDGHRVQMHGHCDDDDQVLKEISQLPNELGIEMAILLKNIYGEKTVEDTSEKIADALSKIFHDGYIEGVKAVGYKEWSDKGK